MDKFLLTYLKEIPSEEEFRSEAIHEIIPYPTENYSNEGSEFLDDAIRTKDQPFYLSGEERKKKFQISNVEYQSQFK